MKNKTFSCNYTDSRSLNLSKAIDANRFGFDRLSLRCTAAFSSRLFLCLGLIVATAVLATLFLPSVQAAEIFYVDDDSTCNSSCGGSWATAYPYLQDALAAAQSGDQIWLAEGVYYPDKGVGQISNDRFSTFTLVDGVAIYGGFVGTETSLEQRNNPAPATVLSGDVEENDIVDANGIVTDTLNMVGDNAFHVVTGSGLDETAVLDNLIINAGEASSGPPNHQGAGMIIDNSSPTLTQVSFIANMGNIAGGMYSDNNSMPALTDVTFQSNWAYNGSGGGMFNANGSHATLTRVTFVDNEASSFGGGLYNSSSNPILNEVIFDHNRANGSGGAITNASSLPELTAVTFAHNSANINGGAIYNTDSAIPLTDVTFYENNANFGGAIYNGNGSDLLLNKVTFYANLAATDGGGIYNNFSDPELTNVTFNENWAGSRGGGMVNVSSSPVLTNVTFAENSAELEADGIYNHSGSPKLINVIIGDSTHGEDCINNAGVSLDPDSSHNLIEATDSYACGLIHNVDNNIIGQDPMLDSLGDNGGSTQTQALLPGSPAIDAGDDTACPAEDQRGRARMQLGDVQCDIGAFERDTVAPQIVSILRMDANPNESAIVDFVVTFSEDVIGLDSNDFSPTTTGTLNGSSISSVIGSGAVYTVTVNAGTGGGSVRLDMPNTATVTDFSANALAGVPYTSGETYTILGIKIYLPMIVN